MTHAVRARLADGWAEQPCEDQAQACVLFDRLRALNPFIPLQRMADGRAVETQGACHVPPSRAR